MTFMEISDGRRGDGGKGTIRTRVRNVGNRYGRSEAARLAVLKAADGLLVRDGHHQVTMEKIALEAGVSKQTIYRWWKSKNDVLFDACVGDLDQDLIPSDSGDVREDMKVYLMALSSFISTSDAGAVLRALIAQAEDDAALRARLTRELLPRQAARDRVILDRAVERGQLVLRRPATQVAEMLVSLVYFRAMVTRDPLSKDELASHVDLIFDGLTART